LTIAQGTNIMADDAALAAAAREDAAAFDALYRRYVTRVYRYCLLRCGNVQDAEDLTAQTFLAALEGLSRYRERGTFGAWLFTIARRKCHDFHRRRYRHPQEPLAAAGTRPDASAADPEIEASEAVIGDCVARVLPQLTEERQEVVRLRYGAGLSTAETAAVMGKGRSAVKMLLLRALNDLRERCLDEDE